MDPHTATREQFTNHLLDKEIPGNAVAAWKKYAENSKGLLRKLAFHDAMAPNLQQTYMTPANSKNKVYFMWDFVGRTLGMLYMIPPTTNSTARGPTRELCSDVIGRSMMAANLILDTKPGMLDMMVGPASSGQAPIAFDEETLNFARNLST